MKVKGNQKQIIYELLECRKVSTEKNSGILKCKRKFDYSVFLKCSKCFHFWIS